MCADDAAPSVRDPVLQKFGANVRTLRQKRGISQERLAHLAGLDRTYVGGIERGERNLALLNILKVARALAVNPADLLNNLV